MVMRTGDHVYHAPSDETWVVAWADHSNGKMSPCGWPTCEAEIADCTVVKEATDEEGAELIGALSRSGRTDAHRAARLAPDGLAEVFGRNWAERMKVGKAEGFVERDSIQGRDAA